MVHCSDLLAAYYAGLAGRMARLPVLCHVRCSYPEISQRDKSFLRAVNRFVFVSHDAWSNFGYRVPARRGTVVYDGVDVLEGEVGEDGQSVRREFDIPAGVPIVGMVARVAPAKDYATLARAAARVLAAHGAVRFLVVGDRSQVAANRAHYEEVRRVLADCGVAPNFIFTDHREDVTRLIAAMDVFVLSTHTEGLPLVILEAMAQGRPVVATEVGGVPEAVADGVTGRLVAPYDADALAAAMHELAGDADLRRRMGEAGAAAARERFTVDRMADEHVALYERVLARTSS